MKNKTHTFAKCSSVFGMQNTDKLGINCLLLDNCIYLSFREFRSLTDRIVLDSDVAQCCNRGNWSEIKVSRCPIKSEQKQKQQQQSVR